VGKRLSLSIFRVIVLPLFFPLSIHFFATNIKEGFRPFLETADWGANFNNVLKVIYLLPKVEYLTDNKYNFG
jgi:hypothetical protein